MSFIYGKDIGYVKLHRIHDYEIIFNCNYTKIFYLGGCNPMPAVSIVNIRKIGENIHLV